MAEGRWNRAGIRILAGLTAGLMLCVLLGWGLIRTGSGGGAVLVILAGPLAACTLGFLLAKGPRRRWVARLLLVAVIVLLMVLLLYSIPPSTP
jgi:hypothetical protein